MAHKTLVNGTAYEIGAGKTMSGGTVYSIREGKSLVNGTAYDVGFAQDSPEGDCTVNIVALAGSSYMHYVEIDGMFYEDSATVTVPAGTVITCYCTNYFDDPTTGIFLGDEQVVGGEGELLYEYTVNGNVTIEMIYYSALTAVYIYED